jgi:uncharacterized membrane protein
VPTWLAIVLIVLGALILVFLAGGYLVVRRRTDAASGALLRDLAAANEQLARARAEDRGWDRDLIDVAARDAHRAAHPDVRVSAVHLVQVVDRPGTEHDEARVRVVDDAGEHEILLGRETGTWAPRADARPGD